MNEVNDNIFINMKFGVNAQKHNNNPIYEAPKETPNSNNSKKEQEPQNNIRLEEYLNGLEYYGAPNHASPKPIIPNNNDKESPSVGINVGGNSTEGAISNEEMKTEIQITTVKTQTRNHSTLTNTKTPTEHGI